MIIMKKMLTFAAVAFAGAAAALAVMCCFAVIRVEGAALEPDIPQGSRVLLNRMAYVFSEPESGDLVAVPCRVYSDSQEGSILVRRIAATGGDVVEIRGGKLYVNDRIYGPMTESSVYMEAMEPVEVETGRVFVIGGSESGVMDSRDAAVGQPGTEELLGKICFK